MHKYKMQQEKIEVEIRERFKLEDEGLFPEVAKENQYENLGFWWNFMFFIGFCIVFIFIRILIDVLSSGEIFKDERIGVAFSIAAIFMAGLLSGKLRRRIFQRCPSCFSYMRKISILLKINIDTDKVWHGHSYVCKKCGNKIFELTGESLGASSDG